MRQPHAVLDLSSRQAKARKIERLLDLARFSQPIRLLEIGTGSGAIAHYFANQSQFHCLVTAVDVVDVRQVTSGYRFERVEGVALPFPDASFDIVISNHVIEHVGARDRQHTHLQEIYRLMSSKGQAYLAVPNRWMVVEPHYRLPFLSWLPERWRTPYLRLTGKGAWYDCAPLGLGELDDLLEKTEFTCRHIEIEALRVMETIENIHGIGRLTRWIPDPVLTALRPAIPTLICQLEKP